LTLVLHTAAYWLVLGPRDAIPAGDKLDTVEFNTIRLHVLKIAARIGENAIRVCITFTRQKTRTRH
jgi:hypothetical protein